jgi:L-ribulose-5-phosphate 3-epimerase
MNFPIGIMQGRLSPPVNGRIQAFPLTHWREEFVHAARLGFSSIEWIFESPVDSNPIWQDRGRAELCTVSRQSGVRVPFVCADYFMEVPLVRMSAAVLDSNRRVLAALIEYAAALHVRGIEIPCVDASAIRSAAEEDELIFALAPLLDLAREKGVELGLETSLPPERFRALLKRIGHPAIKANYDSGNSASLGYDPGEEIGAYGSWINNVHIKDRMLGGGTVPLGTGHADIPRLLALLNGIGYQGEFILQAARGTDDCGTAQRYKAQLADWAETV